MVLFFLIEAAVLFNEFPKHLLFFLCWRQKLKLLLEKLRAKKLI